ncbi:putative clathrin assembly protein At5g57200 [Vigna radiata var. radiata]|uniref:Clathrin assembly protein At5g57200 n=1 Tax=Vigna radiata var. radiata TaxID=3916 RepID=A0A1S3U491_VIGRR|nr:putative clathrin assembly protein At5g57200 [Vigna radiata var. radiata]
MGTFQSFRKAYGALKDSTKVGLAKVNSEYKELDIAIVKATNHVEYPPKERHVRKIFYATSAHQPRADVSYCIHKLSKRLSKTRSWIVAIKALIVIHRTLREGDPTFREEMLNYSRRGHILQISNFKDDSSPQAWDCSAWVRTYALFLEERLECFRVLKYDIESERLTKASPTATKAHSRTRSLNSEELLGQLPALQQLLYRLIACQPEGCSYSNYLVQYALALVLKESFKIYCALNDGIINLVDMFFDMTRHDAVKALNIYKRAGQQAENLADFYEYCKGLELARNFQFPTLRQPPPSFLATMEEYIREAPQTGYVNRRLEYQENDESSKEDSESDETEEPEENEEHYEEFNEEDSVAGDETQSKEEVEVEVEPPPLISTDDGANDLLGLNEINLKAMELEENNAMALAIVPPGGSNPNNLTLSTIDGTTGWELSLVTAQSKHTGQATDRKMAGGFDTLLLDSLYEDENARRQLQLQNAGYGHGGTAMDVQNPFDHYNQQDPFVMSNNIAPPTNVQLALMAQQQQQQMMFQHPQMLYQQQPQQNNMMMMIPHQQQPQNQYSQHPDSHNPFGDPLPLPNYNQNYMPQQGNYNLM